MSGICTGWVLKHGPRDPRMRLVLIAIADAANRDGEHAHPGMAAVMDAAVSSERTVQRHLAKLIDEGWLEIEEDGGGRGKHTVYRVVMERETPSKADAVWRGLNEKPRQNERETPSNGDSALLLTQRVNGLGARKRATPPTPFPVGEFRITADMREWAKKEGLDHLDLKDQTYQLRDWALGNGTKKADWVATWRNWIRRAANGFGPRPAMGYAPRDDGLNHFDTSRSAGEYLERFAREHPGEA
jgi:hypothetical protein